MRMDESRNINVERERERDFVKLANLKRGKESRNGICNVAEIQTTHNLSL